MKKSIIYILEIFFFFSCSRQPRNIDIICNDPFFNNFFIKKVFICKEINGFEFEAIPTYKYISIFYNQVGFLFLKGDKLFFHLIDIRTHSEKTYDVKFEDGNKTFEANTLSFGFNSKQFLLLLDKKIYLGKFSSLKSINLKLVKELKNYIKYIKVFENKAFLVDYGFTKTEKGFSANTYFYILNLNDYSLKYIDLGIPKGFYFTLFYPPEIIDVGNRYIAHSDISEYKINIYDSDGNFITQINKRDTLFCEIDKKLHIKFSNLLINDTINVKSVLDSMRSTFFSGIGIIEKVGFVNDSLLLVRWYGPKRDTSKWYPEIYYDLWIIRKDNPLLVEKNILARFPDDTILMRCYPLYSSRYESGYNYIISFFNTFCLEESGPNETIKEYYERQTKCQNNIPMPRLTVYEYFK